MIFQFPAKAESLSYITEVSAGVMKVSGLNSVERGKFMLALEEAAINTIRYAYEPDEEGLLELKFKISQGKITVCLKDFGKGIDPKLLKIYDVDDIESIVSPNGRGFFLMQAMTDEFMIDSILGKGTEVCISKYLGGVE